MYVHVHVHVYTCLCMLTNESAAYLEHEGVSKLDGQLELLEEV